MTIEIKKSDLRSVQIRKAVGIREIGTLRPDGGFDDSGKNTNITGGLIGFAKGIVGALGGFLVGVFSRIMRGFAFSFTALWGLIVAGGIFLYNFNWNISDEDIDSSIRSIWLSYASQLGGATGQALGYFTCGVLPTAALFVFNPPMAAYILKNTGDEFLDEMSSQLAAVILATVRSTAATGFYLAYKNLRKLIRDTKNPIRQFVPNVDKWGKKGGAIVSIAKTVEGAVNKIKNPFAKNFTESALEELWDGCVEAGFIVAGAADSFVWQQKAAAIAAKAEVVEIVPNRQAPNEKLVLSGTRQTLKPIITNVIATHQLLQNRDVGEIVGYPVYEEISAQPSEITLHFTYSSQKEPPFRVKGAVTARYKVSDVKRGKLDYDTIRLAAGRGGYQWGRYLAMAKLSNGRRLHCYGATPEAAKGKVYDFLPLQKAELLTMNITEQAKEGNRKKNPNLNKDAKQVYPVKCVVVVQKVSKIDSGKAYADGLNRLTESYSFPLWTDGEPYNFKKEINDLFLTDK